MEYQVLFGVDGRSILFQGKEGIVNPMDILANGRIVVNSKPAEIINKNGTTFTMIHDRDIKFVPDDV
jgi:hypothetical protein